MEVEMRIETARRRQIGAAYGAGRPRIQLYRGNSSKLPPYTDETRGLNAKRISVQFTAPNLLIC